ncbi:MAG: 3'-5' exonuclease [Ichthyobacteriaceae bacterium]|nr:3'-5' exonuclease [Ichthyobacteriaceae bacterium]
MKLFFYDLETTGTRFWKNGIHQISGAIVIDGDIKERFNLFVKPNPSSLIEIEALNVCNVTEEQIMAYDDMKIVYDKLVKILSRYIDKFDKKDKFHLVGYNNASFDNQFLRAFFVQNKDKYFGSWFWSDTIDVMVLASFFLQDQRSEIENFKQSTVAKFLGVEVDESKLHDAEYDIDICMEIYGMVGG